MNNKSVLIFGATGNMGGAAARALLARGWQVRAVSRSPQSEKAQALTSCRLIWMTAPRWKQPLMG
ncbi:MAG: NmrA family NAD(P)-binding protein [Ardenticatenaceae bacterium]|nr:NmrA family NAD(P)-binding protein [Ardenticatenaceae bacterium]MCB9445706.1 NmrA family NAD(P)-binding protein [Ardenticatenaceae bacterium]